MYFSNGDEFRNERRIHGWPFEIYERLRVSASQVIGKSERGGEIRTIVYYSPRIKPTAIMINAATGATLFLLFCAATRISYHFWKVRRSQWQPKTSWQTKK